ncbi:MAG: hypothetical protein PVF83_12350 [Anaerolineales bacterium]|jgi:hypothetical protein
MGKKKSTSFPGLSIIGGFIIGIAGFFAAFLAVFNEYDYVGAGLCLIASALAFGLMSNAMFRK